MEDYNIVESMDLVGFLIDNHGAEIVGQLKSLQLVASLTAEQDGEIRKAALNTLAIGYKIFGAQTIWISDGFHTVHMLAVPDIDASFCESDGKDIEEKLIQISVLQAIFASETIQDIIPLALNAILILGQEK